MFIFNEKYVLFIGHGSACLRLWWSHVCQRVPAENDVMPDTDHNNPSTTCSLQWVLSFHYYIGTIIVFQSRDLLLVYDARKW